MIKKYNQAYFKKRDYLDLHLAESIKILMIAKGFKKVLDVGCGTGRLVEFLNENGFEAKGCDNAEEALKFAQNKGRGQTVVNASATELPFKNKSFDLVTALSLIEHLDQGEVKKFLNEAFRVLGKDGLIFIITPNFHSPLRHLRGKKWLGYLDPTHEQFFTPKSLSLLLEEHGFKNIKTRFKTAYNVQTDLHLPGFCRKFPMSIKNFLNWLMTSSPLATFRDNLWISAQKK